MTGSGITIIYDGECPFCSSYVRLVRLRETVGAVNLVDARSDDPRVAAALAADFDLDQGMVVLWQGRQFFGSDAVHLLAALSGDRGGFNALQRLVFSSPRRAALLYPVLTAGRRLYFRLMGKRLIGESKKDCMGRE